MKDYDKVVSCQFLAKLIVRNNDWYKIKYKKVITIVYQALFNSFEEAKQDVIKKAESVVMEEGCKLFAEVELIIQYENRTGTYSETVAFYEL